MLRHGLAGLKILNESTFVFTGTILRVMVVISETTFEDLAAQHEMRARFFGTAPTKDVARSASRDLLLPPSRADHWRVCPIGGRPPVAPAQRSSKQALDNVVHRAPGQERCAPKARKVLDANEGAGFLPQGIPLEEYCRRRGSQKSDHQFGTWVGSEPACRKCAWF